MKQNLIEQVVGTVLLRILKTAEEIFALHSSRTNCGRKFETFRLFEKSETIFVLFYFVLFYFVLLFNNFPTTTETVLNRVISHFVLPNKILSETRSIILVSCFPLNNFETSKSKSFRSGKTMTQGRGRVKAQPLPPLIT